jgi:hypothetical protein
VENATDTDLVAVGDFFNYRDMFFSGGVSRIFYDKFHRLATANQFARAFV